MVFAYLTSVVHCPLAILGEAGLSHVGFGLFTGQVEEQHVYFNIKLSAVYTNIL